MSEKNVVLVTGAAGFVGREVCRVLGDANIVIPVVHHRRDSGDIELDLADDTMGELNRVEHVDRVVHLAAATDVSLCENDPDYAKRANVMGTRKMLEFSQQAGVRTFVYCSTGGVYGYNEEPITEDSSLSPQGVYISTKLDGERECEKFRGKMNIVILRYFFPYGPEQPSARLMPRLVSNVSSGKPLKVNEGGSPIINPCYVTDVAEATARAAMLNSDALINIGGNDVVSFIDLGRIIAEVTNREALFENTSNKSLNMIADITRMRDLLDFKPKTDLQTGIKAVFESL